MQKSVWKNLAVVLRIASLSCFAFLPNFANGKAVIDVVLVDEREQIGKQHDQDPIGSYYDIGNIHCTVSTQSRKAQVWFDRGLAMCHGFNHGEAIRCFEKAIQADPALAMGYWGIAYALGPNINAMHVDEALVGQAVLACKLAKIHAERCKKWEQDLIDATVVRYTVPVPSDRTDLNRQYATAMREVYRNFPDHPVITSLYAESLMDLHPWKLWNSDGSYAEETPEIVAVLEKGLADFPDNPMLCHLYIHALEASPTPGKALHAANRLRNATPGLGHLVHMPSHIDVRIGNYDQMLRSNMQAIEADQSYVSNEGRNNFYSLYRVHNYHFVVYAAMLDGQSNVALNKSRELVREIPTTLLKSSPDFFDAFMATPLHAMIRFGRWEEILSEPEPDRTLPMTRTMWHYARGIAFAATNRIPNAEKEQDKFQLCRLQIPATSMLHNNACVQIVTIAEAMLRGEIEYRKKNYDLAFEYLRKAVVLDDALNYDEPWGWIQPARHALGALLCEQNHFQEAEKVFREDLKRLPNNPWALRGLIDCLKARSAPEIPAFEAAFADATRRSDIRLDRPCFCKKNCCSDSSND